MNSCVFCKIILENNPHHEIWWGNDSHIAFLDASPSKRGHTLVIPRKHTEEILSLSEEEYENLMADARMLAKKMKSFFDATRVAIVVEGMSIAHVHVHLIPIQKGESLGIFSKCQIEPGDMEKLADKLRDITYRLQYRPRKLVNNFAIVPL